MNKVLSSFIIFVVESQHETVKNQKQLARFRVKSLKSYHFKYWRKQVKTFKKLREQYCLLKDKVNIRLKEKCIGGIREFLRNRTQKVNRFIARRHWKTKAKIFELVFVQSLEDVEGRKEKRIEMFQRAWLLQKGFKSI